MLRVAMSRTAGTGSIFTRAFVAFLAKCITQY